MPLPQWPKTLLDALIHWGFEARGPLLAPHMTHPVYFIDVYDRSMHNVPQGGWLVWFDNMEDEMGVVLYPEHNEMIRALAAYFSYAGGQ